MEAEIDLQPYIEVLLRRWPWIAGMGILAALVALATTFIFPPTYEAVALVAVTSSREVLRFDPRIESVEETQPLAALPELALSDDMLLLLLQQLEAQLPGVVSPQDLREFLSASSGSDLSLIRLTAQAGNADEAARIANTWASLYIDWVNGVYGDPGGVQLAFFEEQLDQAATELAAAEDALIAFQSINRTAIISDTLAAQQQVRIDYLAEQRTIVALQRDINALREQLAASDDDTAVTFADQLTALALQLEVYSSDTAPVLQLAISDVGDLTTRARGEQIEYLEILSNTLDGRRDALAEDLLALEPQILELQQELQQNSTQAARLQREHGLAEEKYILLAAKVQEEEIASADVERQVRLASQAATPEEPLPTSRLLYTVVAGVLGALVTAAYLLGGVWWQTIKPSTSDRQV